MKNKILLFLSLLSALMTSCYKDNSNTDFKMVNPISFELDGNNGTITISYTKFMFDDLIIEPIVYKEGTNDVDMSFEWTIQGNGVVPKVIGNTMALKYIVNVGPQSLPYDILYKIRDNLTGIERNIVIKLTILSPFVEGLVIADTRDEMNTDLSLLVSSNFNGAITEKDPTRRFPNVYSSVNGQPLQGLLTAIRTISYGENRSLTACTNKEMIRADHYDYKSIESERDGGMFIIPPKNINPISMSHNTTTGTELLLNEGKVYPRICQNFNRKYNYHYYFGDRPNYFSTYVYFSTPHYKTWIWDESHGGFLFIQFLGTPAVPRQTGGVFDVANMQGYQPIIVGEIGQSNEIHCIMKEKATGKIKSFIGRTSFDVMGDGYAPLSITDISDAQNISSAKYFETTYLENRLYYADDSKVYSYSFANSVTKIQYEVADPNDKITNIELWKENGGVIKYKDLDPNSTTGYKSLSVKDRMMVITTYNESTKEGKITLVPIPIINGDWELDRSFHVVEGGYGRILKIAKQAS